MDRSLNILEPQGFFIEERPIEDMGEDKYPIEDFLSPDQINEGETLADLMEEDDRSLRELIDASLDSKGREVFQDIQALYSTLLMVNENYAELTEARDWFLEQDIDAFAWDKRDQSQDFMKEYSRLLHNYAASVHTMISHAYTFIDRYEDEKPELKEQYFQRLQDQELTVRGDLIKGLRHYTQKYWQPPIGLSLSAGQDRPTERSITVDVDTLLEWDGWEPEVREYLEGLDEQENITNLAEDYQEDVNDFYDWFRMLVLEKFYDEIVDMVVAQAQLEEQRKDIQ
jgi:hypothetical protein